MPPLRKPMKTALPRPRTAVTLAKNGQNQALNARRSKPVTDSARREPASSQRRRAGHKDQHRQRQGRRQQTIEPIQQAAVTGDQNARILDVEAPLGRGFDEVAQLRRNTEQDAYRYHDRRRAGGECRRAAARKARADQAADETGPSLVG